MRLSHTDCWWTESKPPYHLLTKNFFGAEVTFRYLVGMPRLISRSLAVGLCAFLGACATAPKVTKNTSKTFSTVVVDAGHGGKDNGAYRRYGGAEKLATLDVAKRLDRKLRESELNTVMTRSSDVFISLDERVAIENSQKNAIFVSIHFNDSDSIKAGDDSALGQSRRAYSKFPCPAPRHLSGSLSRVRIFK